MTARAAGTRFHLQPSTGTRGLLIRLSKSVAMLLRQSRGLKSAGLVAVALVAASPKVSTAHGGVTGAQDLVQDYGLLLFLVAVILVGAGVLVWVLLAPMPIDTGEPDVSIEAGVVQKGDSTQSSELHETRRVDHEDRRAT